MASGLLAWCPAERGSFPGDSNKCIYSSLRPDWLFEPDDALPGGHRGLFSGSKVAEAQI